LILGFREILTVQPVVTIFARYQMIGALRITKMLHLQYLTTTDE
jgi:hypothetical protein